MKKTTTSAPELLAPAGSLEKMKIAFKFGADAVYFGLPDFSLRARINKFTGKDIRQAAEYCRKINKKFYVTLNIYAHQRHLRQLPKHLGLIESVKPDGVIVSDPGILSAIREKLPKQKIHLSTQANATNSEAVKFWARQGVSRVILAREVTLEEIKEIKKEAPEMELECFVHGAMCMSYSGRCILSKWMAHAPQKDAGQTHAPQKDAGQAGRSANLGDCAQPCRWRYRQVKNRKKEKENCDSLSMSVVDDEERFGVDLEQDRHGTYFFNSYDLCLIEHLDKLICAGVSSLKIEGRSKSAYYVAAVVRAYRTAIDAAIENKRGKLGKGELRKTIYGQKKELEKLSHRGYTSGFLLGDEPEHLFEEACKKSDWLFVGISNEGKKSKRRSLFVHNHLNRGDEVELLGAKGNVAAGIESIINDEGKEIDSAHGGQGKRFQVVLSRPIDGIFLVRKKVISGNA